MTGFMAGATADVASKLPEKTIISKTLAQLDKIFGKAVWLLWFFGPLNVMGGHVRKLPCG